MFNTRYIFLETFGAGKLRSKAFITGPGMYRMLEETKRNSSVKVAGRNSAILKSCDKKAKQINKYRNNEH